MVLTKPNWPDKNILESIYIYKAERVSVCLSVCMHVRYARLNRLSDHNETLHTSTLQSREGYRQVKNFLSIPKRWVYLVLFFPNVHLFIVQK